MALLPRISRSFLQRLTHPSAWLSGDIQMQSGYFCQLHFNSFPRAGFPLFQLISPKTEGFKGDLSGSSQATSSSPGALGEVARQPFSLAGSAMLYAMIYKAQKEPAAVKYISFSFPSSPALLKPPLYANATEDVNGRHQGHELAEHSGKKMALRKEKGRARESKQGWPGWGRAARAPEQIKQQRRR